jgi:hypothetical protein
MPGVAVDDKDLKQVPEVAVEILDQAAHELGPGSPRSGLDGGDVVLTDAQVLRVGAASAPSSAASP